MGCASSFIVVDNERDIILEAEDFARHNVDRQENPMGAYHGRLRVLKSKIFNNEAEAEAWIESSEFNERYKDVAVPFYVPLKPVTRKSIQELKDRRDRNLEAWSAYSIKNRIKNRESSSLTCQKCGSRIMLEYMSDTVQFCPLPKCGADLRSKTVQERLQKYEKDSIMLDQRIKEEEAKLFGKLASSKKQIKWLLKVSVHC